MKKLLFLGACLVALASSPVKAQTTAAQATDVQVAVVEVYYAALNRGHVVITRGADKSESLDFNGANAELRGAYVRASVLKLYQEGYVLKSSFSPGASDSSFLVFIKEK